MKAPGTAFMKDDMRRRNGKGGFTLVELILMIIVAGILGAMFIQVMGTNLTGSVEPLIRAQNIWEINKAMENITRKYNELKGVSATPLATLQTLVNSGNNPENDPYFGLYTIAYNSYITLIDGSEEASAEGILKVTIADENGSQRLTALFTK